MSKMTDEQIIKLISESHIELVKSMAVLSPEIWQLYYEMTSIDNPYEKTLEEIRKQVIANE